MKKIAIIGLGYVGLPLALQAESKGYKVVGIEVDKRRLDQLQAKQSPIKDTVVEKALQKSEIKFTDAFKEISTVDIAIICVPTPVNEDKMPNLDILRQATLKTATHLQNDALLIIESTVNPGVCDEILTPLIEKETKHKVGTTIHLAHCPERINPGDTKWDVGNINRVLGASSETGLEAAYDFYRALTDGKIKKMNNMKEAEAVKVVENSFRDINIAFVNELAISFEKLGINVVNVIDGAATKPFGFMPFYPGIGVGGHCIPVDPYYLIEYARGNGFEHHFLKLARSINDNMPLHTVNKIEQHLIEDGKGNLEGKKVCLLGLSYKPNVGDDRESPANKILTHLKDRKALVTVYDPYSPERSTAESLEDAVDEKDIVLVATPHAAFSDIDAETLKKDSLFFDGRNAYAEKRELFAENNVQYLGVGLI